MTETEWPSDWLRGVLGVAVLRVIAEGPTYGYAISGRLAREGFGEIKGGTLYPLLTRLEVSGFVTTEWRAGGAGPGRKFFALTPDGTQRLAEVVARWHAFATATDAFLTTHTPKETHHE